MSYQIKLGCKKSKQEQRDFKYNIPLLKVSLPIYCDLSNNVRNVFHQLYNDCVANACSNIITSLNAKKEKINTPSRLFIYCNSRCIEDNRSQYVDEGCSS